MKGRGACSASSSRRHFRRQVGLVTDGDLESWEVLGLLTPNLSPPLSEPQRLLAASPGFGWLDETCHGARDPRPRPERASDLRFSWCPRGEPNEGGDAPAGAFVEVRATYSVPGRTADA